MTELDAISHTEVPSTVDRLVADLSQLGVMPGTMVMVHSSLSKLGFVVGGAHAVVEALRRVVGPSGTLMMPTHSTHLSDPESWSNPPIPQHWWDTVRAETPAYDPRLTPTRSMGAIVECFRHCEGAIRSDHPTVSATAVGPRARSLVEGHELAFGLGEASPQARLYEQDGDVLLLGVTHANNTSLHLAEHRLGERGPGTVTHWSPVAVDGRRRWVSYPALDDDDSDFERLGEAFAATGAERSGPVGTGVARLMSARAVVDFAVDWMRTNRR